MKSLSRKVLEHLDRVKINEAYPRELTAIANKTGLKELSRELSRRGIDIQNSDIEPFEVKSTADIRNAGVIIVAEPGQYGGIGAVENNGVIKGDVIRDADFTLNNGKRVRLKNASWKSMLEGGLKLFFIPNKVSNVDLRNERAAAKAGAVGLDRDAKKQRRGVFDTDLWYTPRGYDKSGYKLDTDKYQRMLAQIRTEDNNWKKMAEDAIQEYENYMDLLKSIPSNYSKGLAGKKLDKWSSGGTRNLLSAIGSLADAIEEVFEVASELDEIKNAKFHSEDEKTWETNYYKSELKRKISRLAEERSDAKKRIKSRFSA